MTASRFLLVVVASCVPILAPAQQAVPASAIKMTPHSEAPSAIAARRSGAVNIDGKLDEAAWQAATPITSFTQLDPQEGQPASERTEARVLIDDVAIYVGMRLYDSDPHGVQSQLARRDESIEGDLVELSFDSYHDHLSGYIFRLSPAGARRDATIASSGYQDNSWDAVWEGSATVDAEGWTAEFRIPLSQLRYNANRDEQIWGLQLARKINRKGEISQWSFTPKNEQGGVHRFGHLGGLGRLHSPRHIELVPYVLAKNENPTVAPGDPFRKRNEIVPGAGADLKVGITSNLTLDATFNPDFGQVEVDPAVVNLSDFETFYPERRPFFVEGANIFSFGEMRTNNSSNGYNFTHTRRIGRTPQRGIGGDTITFVDAPLETSILAAAKLTGRSAGGWSLGVLDAVTAIEEARLRTNVGANHTAIVEPRANYFIGRLKRELRGGTTTLGVATTAVNRDLTETALVQQFRRSAYVAGLDWNHSWSNRRWAFDGSIAGSKNIGSASSINSLQLSPARYYQRPDREKKLYDPNATELNGYVAEMTFAKISGLHWKGSLTYQEYSPGFEPNEAGFLGTADMRGIAPLISYSETKPGKFMRNWSQYLFWNPTWNFDGDMTFNGVGAIFAGDLPNFSDIFLRADWRPPVNDDRLTRGGPVARVSTNYGMAMEYNTDRRKRYTTGVYVQRGWNAAGGRGLYIAPRATLRPSTAMRITLGPSFSRSHSIAQFVRSVPDATYATDTYGVRYVFATLDQNEVSLVTRLDWTFTPALSLQLFMQPLVSSGDYIDYKEWARVRAFDFEVYGRDKGTITQGTDGRYTVDPGDGGATFSFGERDFNQRSLRGNAVLRWEYRPGSAIFLVWQQSRFDRIPEGEFSFNRDFDELWSTRPENVFVLKATYWLGR